MSLVEILLRGSAWIALVLSLIGLFWLGAAGDIGGDLRTRRLRPRDQVARAVIGLVYLVAVWLVVAYAAGGGTVNR